MSVIIEDKLLVASNIASSSLLCNVCNKPVDMKPNKDNGFILEGRHCNKQYYAAPEQLRVTMSTISESKTPTTEEMKSEVKKEEDKQNPDAVKTAESNLYAQTQQEPTTVKAGKTASKEETEKQASSKKSK